MNDLLDTIQSLPDASDDLMAAGASVDCVLQRTSIERLIEGRRETPEWKRIDQFEQIAARLKQERCPLDFVVTPGLLSRVIFMPKGAIITSKIHLHDSPFFILSGAAMVWTIETSWELFRAPCVGKTRAGARRVLHILEDCLWVSCHPVTESDPEKASKEIFYDHMKLGHMDDVSPEHLAALLENQKGVLCELQ